MSKNLQLVQMKHETCRKKEVQVAAADNRVVIWGVDAKGYSVRAVSSRDYLVPNLNYLINIAGWQSASGGGMSVTRPK